MKTEKIILITDTNIDDGDISFKIVEGIPNITGQYPFPLLSELTKGKTYTPTAGDKLWIFPYANIPRFKLKQFCQNYKVALVKEESKATMKFAGDDTVNKLFSETTGFVPFTIDRVLEWLKESSKTSKMVFIQQIEGEDDDPHFTLKEFIELVEKIKVEGGTQVFIDEYELNHLAQDRLGYNSTRRKDSLIYTKPIVTKEWVEERDRDNCSVVYPEPGKEKEFEQILTDPLVYHQNDILSKLEGAIMTREMYDRVGDMLKSSDEESQKLAIESMASCDFRKSAVYLLLLLYSNSDTIHSLPSKSHTNFKSLIRFFNLKGVRDVRTVDDIIEALKYQKLCNRTNLDILMPMAMEHIRENGDLDSIKVKSIEITPEVEKAIEENVLDSMVEIVDDPKESVLGEL